MTTTQQHEYKTICRAFREVHGTEFEQADLSTQQYFTSVWNKGYAEKVYWAPVAALSQPEREALPQAWQPLKDVHWVNIVNHDHAYENYDKQDAVNEAVKRTEAKLKEINAISQPSAQSPGIDAVMVRDYLLQLSGSGPYHWLANLWD